MMKKIALLPLALVAIGGYFWLTAPQESSEVQKVLTQTKKEKSVETVVKEISDDELLDDKELLSTDEPFILAETSKIEAKSSEPLPVMSEIDMEELKTVLPSREDIKPVMALTIDSDMILGLKVGDEISIPLPTGVYNAKIDYKKINSGVSVTLTGEFLDETNDYGITITQGKKSSFATITSPNGAFEIEMTNGKGYVYKSSDIEKNIDYSESDTL